MATMSEQLTAALVARRGRALAPEIEHEATRLVVDFLGVGLAGHQQESGAIALAYAEALGGPAESSLLGGRVKVAAPHAAFANAIASHSVELDDVDEEALFHHAPPIVSTALAVGERCRSSGAEVLSAIVAGGETMARLSRATNPQLRDRGFHTTPSCGVFGAAVTAGLLLGLGEGELVHALGLAGAQAGGLMEMYGTSMQKRFNPGPAARDGVTSALLAGMGFTGADTIIEGERGFAAAFAGHFDAPSFLAGLGSEIPFRVEYKPYSCARPIHNAIDAALELRDAGLRAEEVEAITVYRHPTWARYHDIARPRSFHEAQVSLPYSVALALVEGQALPANYARVGVGDELVMALAERVHIVVDPTLARGVSCRVVATTFSGSEASALVDEPSGSLERPMDDRALEAKCRVLAAATLANEEVEALLDAAWRLGDLADCTELTVLFARGAASR